MRIYTKSFFTIFHRLTQKSSRELSTVHETFDHFVYTPYTISQWLTNTLLKAALTTLSIYSGYYREKRRRRNWRLRITSYNMRIKTCASAYLYKKETHTHSISLLFFPYIKFNSILSLLSPLLFFHVISSSSFISSGR